MIHTSILRSIIKSGYKCTDSEYSDYEIKPGIINGPIDFAWLFNVAMDVQTICVTQVSLLAATVVVPMDHKLHKTGVIKDPLCQLTEVYSDHYRGRPSGSNEPEYAHRYTSVLSSGCGSHAESFWSQL